MDEFIPKISIFISLAIFVSIGILIFGSVEQSTVLSSIGIMTVTSNSGDSVQIVGNSLLPSTAGNEVGGITGAGEKTLFMERRDERIKFTGTMNLFNMSINNIPANLTEFHFQVWEREDWDVEEVTLRHDVDVIDKILAKSAPAQNFYEFDTPLAVEFGDYIAFRIVSNGTIADFLPSRTGILGIEEITGAPTTTTDLDWRSEGTAISNRLSINAYTTGNAPALISIGDSLSEGNPGWQSFEFDVGENDVILSNWIGTVGNSLGVNFANFGKGGDTVEDVIDDELDDAMAKNPHTIILFVGVNDANSSVTKASFESDLASLLQTLETAGINAMVIGQSPASTLSNSVMALYDTYDFEGVATNNGATYIDIRPTVGEFRSGGAAGNLWDIKSEYDSGDGLHYSSAGYQAIAGVVYDAFSIPNSWASVQENVNATNQTAVTLLSVVFIVIAAAIILLVLRHLS